MKQDEKERLDEQMLEGVAGGATMKKEEYVPGINAADIPGSPSGACEFAVIDEYAKKDKRVKTTII